MELQELLLAREQRAQRQKELLEKYGTALISFTMNIPGPTKNSPLITSGFLLGCKLLSAQLRPFLYEEICTSEDTGCQGYFVVNRDPHTVKDICTRIEDSTPIGRLFDFDVLTSTGEKLSRNTPRPCLLCGEDARVCRRRGTHTLSDLQEETWHLLQLGIDREYEGDIGSLAIQALLWELYTTPKPGLVDLRNQGSHKDMDLFRFSASVAALAPYFTECARLGREGRSKTHDALFADLRFAGRLAEARMFRATCGVNTHKGAIFSLGLLCAAAGKLGKDASPEELCGECALLCKDLVSRDLSSLSKEEAQTKGQQLYCTHGITGARGQGERGFPAVLHTGLPVLCRGLSMGHSLHRAGVGALLAMLKEEPDTCLISRSSPERYTRLQEELDTILQKDPYPHSDTLEELDDCFIRENLSPGGTADLLALTYFLLETQNRYQTLSSASPSPGNSSFPRL